MTGQGLLDRRVDGVRWSFFVLHDQVHGYGPRVCFEPGPHGRQTDVEGRTRRAPVLFRVKDGEPAVGLRPHVELQLPDAVVQLALPRGKRPMIAVVRSPDLE